MQNSTIKIDLVGHAGFFNRGCEAIVRSTIALLADDGMDCAFRLFSLDAEKDRAEMNSGRVQVVPAWWDGAHRYDKQATGRALATRLSRRYWRPGLLATALVEYYEPWAERVRTRSEVDCALSVGGDNYSLDYGSNTFFQKEIDYYRKRGVATVIWGASIGPFSADKIVERGMAAFLKRVRLITAREGLTQDYLASIGVVDNVVRVWDPAFYLQPEPMCGAVAEYLHNNSVVGINVSALVARWYPHGDLDHLLAEVAKFVDAIVVQGWSILLIPHVTRDNAADEHNDHAVLLRLRDRCRAGHEHIRVLSGHLPASQLKWAISKCRFFIGARTHATIAAVSTGVPSVAIAYSVKARGIWRDVFGNEDLVLPVQELSYSSLLAKWEHVSAQEAFIREHLAAKHGEMIAGAKGNVMALKRILKVGC